jgi:hypothetical protein
MMRNGHRVLSVVLILSWAATSLVAAGEPGETPEELQVKQLLAVATAKAKAEVAVAAMMPLLDSWGSGYAGLYGAIQDQYAKASELLQKIINEESAKPQAEQNAALLQKAKDQAALIAGQNAKYSGKEYYTINARYMEALGCGQGVNNAFTSLSNLEGFWKSAKMDITPAQAAYEALEKRAQEITTSLKGIISEHRDLLKQAEIKAAEARAAVGVPEPAK